MAKTSTELFQEARDRLLAETEVTNLSPGTIARTLLQIYSDQIGELYRYLDTRMLNAYVSTATGRYLDMIGELTGTSRIQSTFANGKVRFYINPDTDTTADDMIVLLNGRDGGTRTNITVPSGTAVKAGDRSYVTITDAVIDSGETEVEVEILATMAGSFGNVEQGGISSVEWNNSVLSILNGILLVTNDAPIESARDVQTDEEYRYFITNSFLAGAKANETAIRVACLSVPGVSDVVIEPYTYGIGTFSVFVVTTAPITTEGTLAAVQQAINETQALGVRGVAVSPDLIGVQMRISLEFLLTTAAADKVSITKQAQLNAINYVNNLRPGDELVVSELSQRIMDTSEEIHDHVIVSLSTGDYNLTTGVIDNADSTLSITNQRCGPREKFVSNSTLLDVCYA